MAITPTCVCYSMEQTKTPRDRRTYYAGSKRHRCADCEAAFTHTISWDYHAKTTGHKKVA